MTPVRMSQASTLPPGPTPVAIGRTVRTLVHAGAGLLILIMLASCMLVLTRTRESAIADDERDLSTIALTLAEQADRAVQAVDVVLDGVARFGVAQGASDAAAFDRIMSDRTVHDMLRERVTGLPQINALYALAIGGRLINASSAWPVPEVNAKDREYFVEMLNAPDVEIMVTKPFRRLTEGTWTVLLVRKMRGADGAVIGILAAALELRYFEEFYRSVSVGNDGTISLLMGDGVQLVRYPPADTTGRNFMTADRILGETAAGTIREPSPLDGTMRLKAARRLKIYPLIMLVTLDQNAALGDWWDMVWVLSLGTGTCCAAIVIAAIGMGRRWQHQEALIEERESRALAEAALMRERERSAENESRAKSGFLAMMSHEIRTPMNGVLALTGTLFDTPLTKDQRKTVEAIRDSGDSLLRILNDILDFSKLDSGRMELEETPFSPATLTHNPVSLLGPKAIAKGLAITASYDDGLPAAMLGDAGRIRQVLINLVSNALKFTERGLVTIHAACPEQDADHATLVWTVTDTGMGIPDDRIGRLFGEFSQADASITRRFGGSGLGLAICKRLIEQMGGTISVKSRLGEGSVFTISLRLPITTEIVAAAGAPFDVVASFTSELKQLGRSARILFAEDNPTNQFVALQLLRGFDVQIDVVADGLEAVHGASSFLYDVICMDIRMPEMDGLAATRAIRVLGGPLATIPIIALTANAFPEDVAACFDAGMTDFVAKPVRKELLLAALLTALRAGGPDRAANSASPAADRPEPVLDPDAFGRLMEEIGPESAAELVTLFTSETCARLLRIGDGGLDRATLIREVHTLKGAAASVCAVSLAARAAGVELGLRQNEALDHVEILPLTEAFDAWRAALLAMNVAEAAAV
jgi:signal transduction histidine kinase/DNA-binding response OmpR family regulator